MKNEVIIPDYILNWYFENHIPLREYLKNRLDNVYDVNSVIIQLYFENFF